LIIIGIELIILQFMFSGLLLQSELFEGIERTILVVTGIFSMLLLALSISAYRKTGIRKILYAAAAFGLFGIQLLFEALEETYEVLDTGYGSIITSAITLAILVLFFLAIVQKNR
jgi:hypothetical protein